MPKGDPPVPMYWFDRFTIWMWGFAGGFGACAVIWGIALHAPKYQERITAERCPTGTAWIIDRAGKPSCINP